MRLPDQHLRTHLLPTRIRIPLPPKIIVPILRNEVVIADRCDVKLLLSISIRAVGDGDDGDGFPFLVQFGGERRSAVVQVEAREIGGVVEVDEGTVVFYDDVWE